MKFPENWTGYIVKKRDLNWGSFGTSISFDFGFPIQSSLFNISIHSKKQWQDINSQEGAKPAFINENSNYVFAYAPAQDATSDAILAKMEEISQILSTFKFTN